MKDLLPAEMAPPNGMGIPGGLAAKLDGPDARNGFAEGLNQVFLECCRVLKSDGLFVFSFHYRNTVAWEVVGTALLKTEFFVTKVIPVRSEGNGGFHSSEGNLRWDAIMVCRKKRNPQPELEIVLFQISQVIDE